MPRFPRANRFFHGRSPRRGFALSSPRSRGQLTRVSNFVSGGQIMPEELPLVTPPLQQQDLKEPPEQLLEDVDCKMAEISKVVDTLYSLPTETETIKGEEPAPVINDEVKNENRTWSDIGSVDTSGTSKEDSKLKSKKSLCKRQRVNRILNKIKPKSSTAILNEIYENVTYNVTSNEQGYQAEVTIEDLTHKGIGLSKAMAQTAAAEAALKHILAKKLNKTMPGEPEGTAGTVCQSHVLSFALYKLLNAWDTSGKMVNMVQQTTQLKSNAIINPIKKFPTNPEKLHPVMLLSQTTPSAKFEEISSTPPPNSSFTIHCCINGRVFVGIGPNKKEAKKKAALEACKEVLGVKYEK